MDREDRQLSLVLDATISKLSDVKNSLASFLFKLENETNFDAMNWPSALDSFATINSQINVVMRFLRGENTPNLRNRILLPLLLNPERDEALAKLTENRVQAFNHEMVPSYLRTKPEPEIEAQERAIQTKVAASNQEQTQKLINSTNKTLISTLDAIKSVRESIESDPVSRSGHQQTFSTPDTNAILAAIMYGKGLKGPLSGMEPPKQIQPSIAQVPKGPAAGKIPSTIKTNIKTTTHPYQRN